MLTIFNPRQSTAVWNRLETIESVDYDKEIYLISGPRCANSITRLILEYLTSFASYGYITEQDTIDNQAVTKITKDPKGVIFKRHTWEPKRYTTGKMSADVRVVCIVRNPLDYKMRSGWVQEWDTYVSDMLERSAVEKRFTVKNVFYEKLMSNPEGYVRDLGSFLDCDPERVEAFLSDLDTHLNINVAPEQNKPNQCEPNLQHLAVSERSNLWNEYLNTQPQAVQSFYRLHYGDDATWREA